MIHLLIHVLLLVLRESNSQAPGQRPRSSQRDLLVDDPARYLATRTFTVGATWDAQARLFPYLFVPFLLVGAVCMVLGSWPQNGRNDAGVVVVALMVIGALATFLGLLFLIPWTVVRFLANARAELRLDGVCFWHGRGYVWCPWALFRVSDPMVQVRAHAVLMAIAPSAVPAVQLRRGDDVVDFGERAANGAFQFVSTDAIELRALHGMHPRDLARLLYHVGRHLG